jgi:hypothetical protein
MEMLLETVSRVNQALLMGNRPWWRARLLFELLSVKIMEYSVSKWITGSTCISRKLQSSPDGRRSDREPSGASGFCS